MLPRETMNRVLEVIRKDVSEDRVKIDTPTQNLESYFLGVVQRAKAAESETSGATSGNKVAAYLRGDADTSSRQPDKVLERFTLPTAASAPAPAVTVAAKEESNEKLAQLTKADEPAPAAATPQKPAESLEKANEKLSGLLGKK
jgi:hypothetical protein